VHAIDETLATLIAPMSVEQFRRQFWSQAPVRIGGSPGKFSRYFNEALWYEHPPREASVTYAVNDEGPPRSKQVAVDSRQLVEFYEAGLVTTGHVDHIPEVARLLDDLRASFQVPTGHAGYADTVLCFRSKDNVGWSGHWDLYHVFVLQIAGRKRWRYSRAPLVRWPHVPPDAAAPGQTIGHFDGRAVPGPYDSELEDVVLCEGDFLYMPPGTWHAPTAQGHSCHLAVAIGHRAMLDVLLDAVRDELMTKAEWRAGVPALEGDERVHGGVPDRLIQLFSDRFSALHAELAELDRRRIHQRWASAVAIHAEPDDAAAPGPVQRHERLRRSGSAPIRYALGPALEDAHETEVFVYSGEATASLPEEGLVFVRALTAHQEFVAESALAWDPDLDWDEVQEALTDLVRKGILRRA
jgi:ribosomal protein L16 Arg81 hydroxylase